MKTLMRWTVLAVLLLSAVVTAQGQNLAGQWQGTLEVGKSLRLVIVVRANAAGGGRQRSAAKDTDVNRPVLSEAEGCRYTLVFSRRLRGISSGSSPAA